MIKNNRHLVLSSITTRSGPVGIGARGLQLPVVPVAPGGPAGRLNLTASTLLPLGGEGALRRLNRPFPNSPVRREVIALPEATVSGLRAFYDATNPTTGAPPIHGLEYLGWGYNVFGPYASPSGLKWPLFDCATTPLVPCAPPYGPFRTYDFVKVVPLSISQTDAFFGETLSQYAQDLSISANLSGSYSGFWGQINEDYSSTEISSSCSVFARARTVVSLLALHLDLDRFRSQISQEAKQDLDGTMKPEDVFDKYGAYFLSGILVGGKVYRNYCANRYQLLTTSSLETDAEASFLGFIGASANVLSQSASCFSSSSDHSGITTVGGDPTLGGGRILEPGGYARWADSVAGNPVFVDFTAPDTWPGLTPVWELCTNATRKAKLSAAFAAYSVDKNFLPAEQREEIPYGIGIKTGTREDAGTDASVWIELIGQKGRSGLKFLGNEPAWFERGHENYFNLVAQDIGELSAVRLKHDNSGNKAGWFVDLVRVTAFDRIWQCNIYHWIAKSEAPKRLDITFDLNGNIIG